MMFGVFSSADFDVNVVVLSLGVVEPPWKFSGHIQTERFPVLMFVAKAGHYPSDIPFHAVLFVPERQIRAVHFHNRSS